MTDEDEALLTTSQVAEQLGVTDGTVRRYIKQGVLVEPGWARRGRARQRAYSNEWLKQAKAELGL